MNMANVNDVSMTQVPDAGAQLRDLDLHEMEQVSGGASAASSAAAKKMADMQRLLDIIKQMNSALSNAQNAGNRNVSRW